MITKLYLSQKIQIIFFVILSNTIISSKQVHIQHPTIVNIWQRENIERRGYFRGLMIVVRKIVILIIIVWLHWFFSNTLLYPTSVSDCPWTERDVFSIALADLIFRSALVGFSLLSARYYYNLTGIVGYVYYV